MQSFNTLGTPFLPSTLVELLHQRALEQPERCAYSFLLDGETAQAHLTYGELDRKARAIGVMLQSLSWTDKRALLLYPPGLDYIAAFFGCLYAGWIAVPAYPPQLNRLTARLQAITADCQATVALTTMQIMSNMKRRLATTPALEALLWLATDNEQFGQEAAWQEPELSRDSLAFLQYTSGSTSTPKGVMLTHGNLLHNLSLIRQCFGQTLESRGVVWLPPYHDMGLIGGILQPLYVGYPMTLMSPTTFLQHPLRWLQAISDTRATTSGGPNFAFDLCVRKTRPAERATLDLSCWEVAFNGAEPIRHETFERFAETFEPYGFRREAFHSCYGLAEATLIVSGNKQTAKPVVRRFQEAALEKNLAVESSSEDEGARALVGCGAALSDQRIEIVHPETLMRRSAGHVGEVWVAGPSVAQGYWNRAEETEATFGAHLSDSGEGAFLRTGDLGFIKDGELFITGRLKDLIIIRGRNHYPQDIELTVEQSHDMLRAGCGAAFSVVVGGEERLVIVQEVERRYRNPEVEQLASVIRRAVRINHELHAYAVVLIRTGSIPKTSSGKIQRHSCRAGFLSDNLAVIESSILDDAVAEEGQDKLTREALLAFDIVQREALLEADLLRQVARVLQMAPAQLQPAQPLDTLGLDSLMAVELKNYVEELGVNISMVNFLQGYTISELATEILTKLTTTPTPTAADAPVPLPLPAAEPTPSIGQSALWFMQRLASDSSAYNISSAVRLHGELNAPALRRCFQKLVDRHASLRTTFPAPHGKPVQNIHEHREVSFQEVDATTWTQTTLNAHLGEEAQRTFDLTQDALLRINLYRLSRDEHVLLFVVHHIVTDFWSLTVIVQELNLLYAAESSGASVELAPLPLQYTDYVAWQEELLSSPAGERLWLYWQQQLGGELPVLNLPASRPRPPHQTFQGAALPLRLDADLTQSLKALAQSQGATLYMVLLAAFQVLLHRYTGQDDILIGSPMAGRNSADLTGLVGYFVNPVVLRANLSGNPTFVEFLKQVRQTAHAAYEHQDFPFPLLVERLQPVRDYSRSPLFQVMLILHKAHGLNQEGLAALALGATGAQLKLGDLTLESLALEHRASQFDLTLIMAEVEGGMRATVEYSTDLFDHPTIARLLQHFHTLLAGIAAD
ncbi:MAG: condensation domain-containing protein, partial [Acidobacteria bacterium]|nr:condensation domain-containing protein [Acidobacteriota bacterium]